MEAVHPHDPKTREAAKLLGTKFGQLIERSLEHVRVDMHDRRQYVHVIGTAAELHGPQGKCTCCPRRRRRTVDGDEVGT